MREIKEKCAYCKRANEKGWTWGNKKFCSKEHLEKYADWYFELKDKLDKAI